MALNKGFFENVLSKGTQKIGQFEKYARNSNKAINSVYTSIGKAGRTAEQATAATERLASAGTAASTYSRGDAVRFGMATYAGANIAGRVLSGGGVYKDAQGNTDIAGIPFI